MNLSPHFTLAEAMASNAARDGGFDNTPPEHVIPRLRFVAETILEPIRAAFNRPIIFNGQLSWYRSPRVNDAAGGVWNSQHMTGEAVDVEIAGVSNIELAYFVRDTLKFDQLILEHWNGRDPSSGWVHVSACGDRPMRQMVRTFSGGKSTPGLP